MRKLLHPAFYFRTIGAVVRYTRKPTLDSLPNHQIDSTVPIAMIALFFIGEVLSIVGVLPKALLEEYDLINDLENVLSLYQEKWPTWKLFLVGGALAPLLEEVTWRLHLKFSRTSLIFSTAGLAYYALGWVLGDYTSVDLTALFVYRALAGGTVAVAMYFGLRREQWRIAIKTFWLSRFRYIYWFMIVSFAAMHVSRYQNFGDVEHFLILPLIFLPQLISGALFGYVRMHYGFWYALGLHVFGNTYLQVLSTFL